MVHYQPWPLPSSVPVTPLGVAGILVGFLGSVAGLYALFTLDVYPLGGVVFVLSFILLLISSLYAMAWGWTHIPYPERTPPQTGQREPDGTPTLRLSTPPRTPRELSR